MSQRCVLALNRGSSSVRSALFTFAEPPAKLHKTVVDLGAERTARQAIQEIERETRDAELVGIGHRIVHGGPHYHEPTRITTEIIDALKVLIPLAPNHLPAQIELLEEFARVRPDVPQFACFDTGFHHDLPDVARRLPLPTAFDRKGVRRYGFHGLSYTYLMKELQRLAGVDAGSGRVVLAHLGNGSSLAAVYRGRCVDTSMGFTPTGGVVMSTRSGDLDPGVAAYLVRMEGLSVERVEQLLTEEAGLLGISGTTGDMRELLAAEPHDPAARLAITVYCYEIRKRIASYAAALGGLDTLVFSGGIGEHAAVIRAQICAGLAFLGIELDEQRNSRNAPVLSRAGTPVTVRMIPTDEEMTIAEAAHRLLA